MILAGQQGEDILGVVTLETFLVWLTMISFNRIDEQYREKLRLYQKESGKALRKTFFPQAQTVQVEYMPEPASRLPPFSWVLESNNPTAGRSKTRTGSAAEEAPPGHAHPVFDFTLES